MITLIHPSRGRPDKAKATYDYWMQESSGNIEIEHIISLDQSDPTHLKYFPLFPSSFRCVRNNDCVVQATNEAAKISHGNVLIYLSDDFKCPQHWDVIVNIACGRPAEPVLMKVDDCLQPFNVRVLTIPIMNRLLYEKLGYFFHPEYKSMFCDQHLFEICNKHGWIDFSPEWKFPHEHPANGKAENDETYMRSSANWNQGLELFHKHRMLDFPL